MTAHGVLKLVNIASVNDLLFDGTKSLPKPMFVFFVSAFINFTVNAQDIKQ